MTDKLPPPLLALFQPRPPLRYLPPSDRAPEDCGKSTISGVAQFLADAKSAEEIPYNATESWIQRKYRQKIEKKQQQEKQLADGLQNCKIHLTLTPDLPQDANMAIFFTQSTLKKILKLEAIHSKLSLSRDSVMKSKKPTWNESSADLVPLREYVSLLSF